MRLLYLNPIIIKNLYAILLKMNIYNNIKNTVCTIKLKVDL